MTPEEFAEILQYYPPQKGLSKLLSYCARAAGDSDHLPVPYLLRSLCSWYTTGDMTEQ